MSSYRYDNVTCSQCGKDLGPGDHGVSSCHRHQEQQAERRITGRRETDALQATAYQSLMGKKLAEQQRDEVIEVLREMLQGDAEAIEEAKALGVPFPPELLTTYEKARTVLARIGGGA